MNPASSPDRPAVVFDLGKVLVDFDFRICARKMLAQCQIPLEQIRFLIQESEHLCAFETGLISPAEFYQRVRHASGFTGSQAEFELMFADIFTPISPMVELLQALRAQGLETFVFSNTNELAVRHITNRYEFYRKFHGYILSFEQHVMKPQASIYEAVETIAGRLGSGLIYFDDRQENIDTALQRGWRAFVHKNPGQTLAIVRSLGL